MSTRFLQSRAREESPITTGETGATVPDVCPEMTAESGPGVDVESRIALDAPNGDRDGRGRFADGNRVSLKTGTRSRRSALERYPAAAAALRAKEAAIVADLGGPDTVSTTRRELVTRFVEASAVADSLASDFIAHGVTTIGGRTRRSVSTYLATLDRLHRLAGAIGLERQSKRVTSLADLMAAEDADQTPPDAGAAVP